MGDIRLVIDLFGQDLFNNVFQRDDTDAPRQAARPLAPRSHGLPGNVRVTGDEGHVRVPFLK
eukprot:CAMPEP_0115873166 /NCGR_PEP_ID=MMETSP0287-20121206/23845_1 /TAXON_ID=412157 /ORGANISM="Chrysochromulina rotalis, Strain UIO044" /LENGTH=61 /DNA_ID=CAMNT_0003328197 /DNA_START=428 /DNA_END=613 /DNA_ORIENTATION=-